MRGLESRVIIVGEWLVDQGLDIFSEQIVIKDHIAAEVSSQMTDLRVGPAFHDRGVSLVVKPLVFVEFPFFLPPSPAFGLLLIQWGLGLGHHLLCGSADIWLDLDLDDLVLGKFFLEVGVGRSKDDRALTAVGEALETLEVNSVLVDDDLMFRLLNIFERLVVGQRLVLVLLLLLFLVLLPVRLDSCRLAVSLVIEVGSFHLLQGVLVMLGSFPTVLPAAVTLAGTNFIDSYLIFLFIIKSI